MTRAVHQAAELTKRFEGLGASVRDFPTIEILPPKTPPDLSGLDRHDWIVFTSANAAVLFAEALRQQPRDREAIGTVRICAVGPGTAAALEGRGFDVTIIPKIFLAESVAGALEQAGGSLEGKSIFFPRGDLAREELGEELVRRGAQVARAVVYRTVAPAASEKDLDALAQAKPHVVTFTSSSSARNWCAMLGPGRLARLADTTAYASIGPVTSKTAGEHGIACAIEPLRHDVPGLVDAVVRWRQTE